MSSQKLLRCIACGGEDLIEVIDFGEQPLANNFLEEKSDTLEVFPLIINYCKDCTHCQLSIAVDPSLLFAHYLYVSGTTDTLKKHFSDISDTIKNLDNVKKIVDDKNINHVKILDIGSNDNTFLNVLKNNGFIQLYGVDPASNINKTNADGLNIFSNFWSSNFVNQLLTPNKYKFDVITAFNVFAHNLDPEDFMTGVDSALADDGVAIFQFPIFESSLVIKDFGQIYHEHISYFNYYSFSTLMNRCNFNIVDFKFYKDIHGGTAQFIVKKNYKINNSQTTLDDLKSFEQEVFNNIEKLNNIIDKEYRSGSSIVAYGASAKSSTLFNIKSFINQNKILAIIDDNPIKVNKFCPGSNIPIVPLSHIQKYMKHDNLVIIITAHNFKNEIIRNLKNSGIHGKVVSYVPEVIEEYI